MKFLLIILGFQMALQGSDIDPQRYSMAELELMAKRKQWANIVLFIKDIPKAEQDLQWKSLLERAAIGYVNELRTGGFSDSEKIIEDLLTEFPSLRDSLRLSALRVEILMSGFEKCFSNPKDVPFCTNQALKQLSAPFANSELRQKLAQLILLKSESSLESVCQTLLGLKEVKGIFEKRCPLKNIKTQ
jgi:hypothetical protein